MQLELKNTISEQESNLVSTFNKFKTIINYIIEFNTSPDDTTDKIIKDTTIDLKDSFTDIQTGLKGTFTRSHSIEIGINKLTTELSTILSNLKSSTDKLNLTSFKNELHKEVKGYVKSLNNIISIDNIERRQERYSQNSLTIDLIKRKIDDIGIAKVSELGSSKPVNNLLFAFREIVSMINLCELTDVDKVYDQYSKRKDYIKSMYQNIGTLEFQNELLPLEVKIEELKGIDLLKHYIEDVPEEAGEINTLDIVNSIVNNLERYVTGFKENLDKISTHMEAIITDNELLEVVLVDLIEKLVTPYIQNSITSEEFNKKLKDTFTTIENILTIDKDLRLIILNTYIKFVNNIDVFLLIYQIIDEITFYGTIKEPGEDKVYKPVNYNKVEIIKDENDIKNEISIN